MRPGALRKASQIVAPCGYTRLGQSTLRYIILVCCTWYGCGFPSQLKFMCCGCCLAQKACVLIWRESLWLLAWDIDMSICFRFTRLVEDCRGICIHGKTGMTLPPGAVAANWSQQDDWYVNYCAHSSCIQPVAVCFDVQSITNALFMDIVATPPCQSIMNGI